MQEKIATTGDSTFQFLGHKLKRPVRVSIRFLIFMLMKKQSIQGPEFAFIFHAHEKMTRWGHFFNLHLRMVAMPLREHV